MRRLPILVLLMTCSVSVLPGNDSLFLLHCGRSLERAGKELARGDAEAAQSLIGPLIRAIRLNEITDSALIADIFFQEGNVILSLPDPPGAVGSYREARQYATDPLQTSRIDQNLGAAYFLMDDYRKAALYLNHSFMTIINGGWSAPSRLLEICENLGSVWFETGDYQKAETWWNEAERINKEYFPADRRKEAGIVANLGNISFGEQEWSRAAAYYYESLQLLNESGVCGGQETALVLRNLSLALGRAGRPDSALSCLSLAEKLLNVQGTGNMILRAELCRAEGAVYLHQDDLNKAVEAFNRGLSAIPQSGFHSYPAAYERFRLKRDKAFALYNDLNGRGEPDSNRLQRVFNELQEAINSYGALCSSAGSEWLLPARDSVAILYRRALETGYEMVNDNSDSCVRLVMEFFSGIKCTGGNSFVKGQGQTPEVPDSIADLANSLDRQLFYYHKTSLQDPNSFGLPGAGQESQVFRTAMLRDSLSAHFPALRGEKISSPGNPVDQGRVMSVLEEGEVLLDYVLSGRFIFVLACSRDTCMVIRTTTGKDLLYDVREFEKALQSADQELVECKAPGLWSQLINPLAGIFHRASRIIVIPDRLLASLPFECLAGPATKGPGSLNYMVGKYSFSYQNSLPDFLVSRRERSARSQGQFDWFGCAPSFDQGEGPIDLQFSTDEVEGIAALFRMKGKKVLVAEGPRAGEREFLDGSSGAEIIHIASHSSADPLHPELSGVLFWKDDPAQETDPLVDGILEIGEMRTAKLNCDLLVFSSCTLNGHPDGTLPAEGPAFPARLMNAGASMVLFSLWNVPDRYTSALMKNFYRFYLSGSDYEEALQNAKLELLKDPSTSNPFIWGGFILYGSE